MKCHIVLTVIVLAKICFITGEKVPMDRDKRTLDTVLRSVADAFGYDIQKRPSLLQAAPTTPAPRVSTFPPPLKPLPPAPKPAIFNLLTPRASLPPAPAPILPLQPPRKAPAIRPRVPSVPPLPPLPRVPLTPPKAPAAAPPRLPPVPARTPQAPPKSPPIVPRAPPPLPPKPAASMQPPPPPPAPSGLTESFQKTFNLNFNWNKNVMPITPGAPAAAPSKSPPAPPPPPPPRVIPASPPPPPASKPAPPQQPPPPPAPAVNTRKPGGQQFIHKPQLYQDYDYANLEVLPEHLIIYEDDETAVNSPNNNLQLAQEQLNYDYPEYQQAVNQDYSESENNYSKEPQQEDDHAFSREKFKKSVNEFWQNYPLSEQHGYKYIAEPEVNQPDVSNPTNIPRGFSKYEEYDVKPEKKKKVVYRKNKTKPAPKGNDYEDDKAYTRIYLIPKDYLDEQVQYETESEEKPLVGEETIAHTRFLGVSTPQLHQLASSESESKPWSVPFDYDLSSSEIQSEVVKVNKSKEELGATPEEEKCCFRESSSGDFDFYTVPEPESVDYSKYEKLYTDEDDQGLSKNAKIHTNEKVVSILNTNKFENPVQW